MTKRQKWIARKLVQETERGLQIVTSEKRPFHQRQKSWKTNNLFYPKNENQMPQLPTRNQCLHQTTEQ